ncbi:serine hydrolase domain-containing protein [Paenibacillus humicola]|uniref:serine hydrolase domain-containing protein n=1 Tax=Paenibacillus humicola TaxID=3110540 RepID=UPI00237C4289|nr:serine hydrolase [Paenibacillus humicola]
MLQTFTFPRRKPQELGIAPDAIGAFLQAVEYNGIEMHSFMIVRHGAVAAEGAWAPYALNRPHMLFSLSKSFSSTAIGFAVQEGRLTVDDLVIDLFPEYVTEAIAANMSGLRLRHLLSMSTGHDVETGAIQRQQPEGDFVKAFLETPIAFTPGTHFLYNSGASYMLSAIITKLTGQTLVDYLKPRLFDPLGIAHTEWDTCPLGRNIGASGLQTTNEAIAKFGQLYLQKGMWNGRRLLSEAWVEEASAAHIPTSEPEKEGENDWACGYGYQFWRCKYRGAYRGDGAFGQMSIVLPEQDAVIALLSGTDKMGQIFELVWEHLLPGFRMDAGADVHADDSALQRQIAALVYPPQSGRPVTAAAAEVSGKTFRLEPNAKAAVSVSYTFEDGICVFKLKDDRGEHAVRCGIGSWMIGETLAAENEWVQPIGKPWTVAASGAWKDETTFVMSWRFIETTFTYTITSQFEGERLSLHFERNLTFNPFDMPPIEGRAEPERQ